MMSRIWLNEQKWKESQKEESITKELIHHNFLKSHFVCFSKILYTFNTKVYMLLF